MDIFKYRSVLVRILYTKNVNQFSNFLCKRNIMERKLYRCMHEIVIDGRLPKLLKTYNYRIYCTSSGHGQTKFSKHKEGLKAYLEQNKGKLRNTEQRLKEKGNIILQDIKETKTKVKEKVEEIVEVILYYFNAIQ